MTTPRMPVGLGPGGRALWKGVTSQHEITQVQAVHLTEACRQKDRLDKLDGLLRGDVSCWSEIVTDGDGVPVSLRIDGALTKANDTANAMKQLLAAMRLPDEDTGKRPQRRGARGAQKPSTPGGKVSSLDRARERKSG